jgi:hypothetical protein
VIVCLPGGQARRRLLELLVEEAAERGLVLAPPQIVTPGSLPELLYEAKHPFASDLVQQLAWVKVLQGMKSEQLAPLVRNLPGTDDLPAWLALGKMLADLHCELSADGVDCAAVLEKAAECDGFNEAERWKLLADLERRYLRLLDELQLWDKQTARLYAIDHRECRTNKRIVLIGLVDLNRAQRRMLDQVAERATALVFAPSELAGRFDEHGGLRPEQWQDMELPLSDKQIEIADGPADQADAVIRALAALNGRYSAEEIVIGVPDTRLAPYVDQRLEESGLPVRYSVGAPLERSGPHQLLAEAADYLEHGRFRDLASLVRHPAVAVWLRDQRVERDWLASFDAYFSAHLPARVPENWPLDEDSLHVVRRVQGALAGLLAPLRGKPQPLDQWAQPALEIVSQVFGGRPMDEKTEADRTVLVACRQILDVLKAHVAIPEKLSPLVTGAQALRIVLRGLEGGTIPPRSDSAAIELLGWLELPWNDAPAMIVTGFNEGIVPASRSGDRFLPNSLRRRLGLEDDQRRYARDAYALALLGASRAELRIIAGRRSADGGPLIPSRLLFACDDSQLARRTVALFRRPSEVRRRRVLAAGLRPGREDSALPIPAIDSSPGDIESLKVTEFRDYLACPYRYYLRHRLRLRALDDSAPELDGGQFGTLLHDVLRMFGEDPVRDSETPEEIRQQLFLTLGTLQARQFGESPMPAVRVQIELLKLRLAEFAVRQAAWRRDGWKIKVVERDVLDVEAPFPVDGVPVYLRGRIDRLDFNERDGRHAVLDYKSSETAKTPDAVHRRHGEWVDLQLPLYRHLVKALEINGDVQLGYVLIPKALEKTGFELAAWTAEELAAADRMAEEVVRGIRLGQFPMAASPPDFFEEFAAICQDDQFGVAGRTAGDPDPEAE